MARFNSTTPRTRTENLAGGRAYKESDKLALVSLMLTSFVKAQFYRSEDEQVAELKRLCASIEDKQFVAKAALFARNEFGMRSITHLAAADIAENVKGQQWTKRFFDKVVFRPDDMLEILAAYGVDSKPVPAALKKGFASALRRFDKYQLAKYRGEGKAVNLYDVVNLVHPKSTEAIRALISGELVNTDTWESKLSAAGGDAEAKTEAWRELLVSGRLGYFALLRNLRNIIQQAPEFVDLACKQLVDPKAVRASKVFPFRFITAAGEIEKISAQNYDASKRMLKAIGKALDVSCENVPEMPNTLVVVDESGSMGNGTDSTSPMGIASLFAAILVKATNADLMCFSDNAAYRLVNSSDSVTSIAADIVRNQRSGGTNFHAIFPAAQKAYERVIILSDMQGWVGYNTPAAQLRSYEMKFGVKPFIYSFDLQGYGTLQFPEDRVFALAGFSDRVLDFFKLAETDKNALVNKIESIEL